MTGFTVLIILPLFHNAISEIIAKPQDTETVINQTTYFNCSTSDPVKGIFWYHYALGAQESVYIYFKGKLQPGYESRTHVERTDAGAFNLVIHSVQIHDAGKYFCQEEGDKGLYSWADLIVLGMAPSCKSIMKENEIVGPNSCGIEKEEFVVTCEVTYHGNIPPIIEWKKNEIDLRIPQKNNQNAVSTTLHILGEWINSDSSFTCQTKRSITEQQYWCSPTSSPIKILYVFNNFSLTQKKEGEEAVCSANSSQICTYSWYKYDNDHEEMISSDWKVTLLKTGMYRCEAQCAIKNKSCLLIAGQVQVKSDEECGGNYFVLFVTFAVLFGIFGSVVLCALGLLLCVVISDKIDKRRKKRESKMKIQENVPLTSVPVQE